MMHNLQTPLLIWWFKDGKAGHERQVEGLLHALSELCNVKICEINLDKRHFANLHKVLKMHQPINKPSMLIGAGHRGHLPILFARLLTGAFSVVLMKPSLPRCLFDFRILPKHDGIQSSKRDWIVEGVLNPIKRSRRHESHRGLMLIGGLSRHIVWSNEKMLRQISQIQKRDRDIHWWVTSSRRTPPALIDSLSRQNDSRFTFVPHDETPEGWVADQLARARQTWVSPESISMLFEALTCGTRVGVFEMDWKPKSKLHRALNALIDDAMCIPFAAFENGKSLHFPKRNLNESARTARWLLEQFTKSQA